MLVLWPLPHVNSYAVVLLANLVPADLLHQVPKTSEAGASFFKKLLFQTGDQRIPSPGDVTSNGIG